MSAANGIARTFRAFDANFRKSALWRKIVRQHSKSRVKDFRCFISHLIECCGQSGATCDDSVLSGFEATYGEDPTPLIEYLSEEGFMRYDEETGWIWLVSGAWWQNSAFNGDCSGWYIATEDNVTHKIKGGRTCAIASWRIFYREIMLTDFPFKREFVTEHYKRLRLDLAAILVPGFDASMLEIIGESEGPWSDGGQTGVRRGSDGGQTPLNRGSDPPTKTRTRTGTETRRSVGNSSPERARVAPPVPTDRPPNGDAGHLDDVPHTLDSEATSPIEPEQIPEPPRSTTEDRGGAGPARKVGSPTITESKKVGSPSVTVKDRVRPGHPMYGMGSGRPPPPLVTLDAWRALPLDEKVRVVAHPVEGTPEVRQHVNAIDDAAQVLFEHHANAVADSGSMMRGDGLDAARRALVFLTEELRPPIPLEEAADRLMVLVEVAAKKPDVVGRPLAGGVPAWVSPDALFGAAVGAKGFAPTAQRLPDNLNRAKSSASVAMRTRLGAKAYVAPEVVMPEIPGFTPEMVEEAMNYQISRALDPSVARDAALEALLERYMAAINAPPEGVTA